MFHLFNDLIVPLFWDAHLSSSTKDSDKNAKEFKQRRNLFLLKGDPNSYNKRAIMFDVLYKLFDTVQYPLEAHVTDDNDPNFRGVCFERYIWQQRLNA